MKKCLIVLGMHRSGTSAVAGFFYRLGIAFGSKLLTPNERNEKGYFENSYIVNANDNILQTLGSSWDDLCLLEEEWWQDPQLTPHRDAVKQILEKEFYADELFCIKDPRISILLPLWISILRDLNIEIFFVIPLRHPIEVAESLKSRDGFSVQKGLILWMNNMLSIEYYTRPFGRRLFGFDDFLEYPADIIRSILDKFNINLPDAKSKIDAVAKEFLDPKLKHHNIKSLNVDRVGITLIDRLNAILSNTKNNTKLDEKDLIIVDEIRRDCKILSSVFYNQDIKNALLSFANLNGQIAGLNQVVTERDCHIASLNQAVAERDGQIASLNQAMNDRESQIILLTAEQDKITSSRSWQITMPLRFISRLLRGY